MIFYYITLAFILNIIVAVFVSLRYKYILQKVDVKITFLSSFIISGLAYFLSYLIPFKGGAILGYPLSAKIKENISLKKSYLVLFFENVFDTLWQIIVLFVLLFLGKNKYFDNAVLDFIIILGFFAVLLAAIFKHEKVISFFIWMYRLLPLRLKNLVEKIGFKRTDFNEQFSRLKLLFFTKGFLFNYFLFSLVIIIINPLVILYLTKSFSYNLTYFNAFFIYWVSYILGRLSGLPVGLGIRDAAIGTILYGYGIHGYTAVNIVILQRIITLFPFFPTGLIYSLIYGKSNIMKLYNEFKDKKEE